VQPSTQSDNIKFPIKIFIRPFLYIKKAPQKSGALAFGIDRNQESFFRKMKIPADAATAAVT